MRASAKTSAACAASRFSAKLPTLPRRQKPHTAASRRRRAACAMRSSTGCSPHMRRIPASPRRTIRTTCARRCCSISRAARGWTVCAPSPRGAETRSSPALRQTGRPMSPTAPICPRRTAATASGARCCPRSRRSRRRQPTAWRAPRGFCAPMRIFSMPRRKRFTPPSSKTARSTPKKHKTFTKRCFRACCACCIMIPVGLSPAARTLTRSATRSLQAAGIFGCPCRALPQSHRTGACGFPRRMAACGTFPCRSHPTCR